MPSLARTAATIVVPLLLLLVTAGASAQEVTAWTARGTVPAIAYQTGWRTRVLGDDYALELDGRRCPAPCEHVLEPSQRHHLRLLEPNGSVAAEFPIVADRPREIRVHREDRTWVNALGGLGIVAGSVGGGTATYFFGGGPSLTESHPFDETSRLALLIPMVVGVALIVLGIVGVAQPSRGVGVERTHDERRERGRRR